ncbi:MAG: Flp pilus assembly protein CpaB [Bdellovibrionales bacterium]|nr:Flp pilus assembly protein CpaB [Bdellovibrionales bacterium]
MNNRAMTMALVIALIAVFLVSSWVSDVEERAKKRFGTNVLVLKAKIDIKESQTITQEMLYVENVPKTFKEPSAIAFERTSNDDEENNKDLQKSVAAIFGTVAIVPIKKGEQITYNKITEPGIRTGLAPQVAPGRRAIAMNVSNQSSVSKLIKPGDRVDVIAVLDMGAGKDSKISKTILQDVVVLSVGQNVTNNIARKVEVDGNRVNYKSLSEDSSYDTVTIEVDPEQAQVVALVAGNGENALTLILRNNDDTERKNFGSTMMSDILGGDAGRIQRNTASQRR